VTGGAERFGDEQLAALLGGRPLGRDVATLEQETGGPLADSSALGLTVAMPDGNTQHWTVRLDQTAPVPLHATGTIERRGALLWAAVAISAAGMLVLLLVLRILRGGRRRAPKDVDRAAVTMPVPAPSPEAVPAATAAAVAPRRLQLVVTAAHGVLWESQVSAEEWLVSLVSMQGGEPDPQRARTLVREAMLGRIRSADLWRALAVRGDPAELDAAYAARFTLDPEVVDFATALARRGIGVACISNDVAEWSALVRARFGLERFIRPFVVSSEVGALSPAPVLFEEVATRAAIPLANCLYIDEDIANLDVARDLGMSTVLLGPSDDAVADRGHGHAVDLRDLLLRRGERVRP
jgi:putative hydrolase of the HAD superfamily